MEFLNVCITCLCILAYIICCKATFSLKDDLSEINELATHIQTNLSLEEYVGFVCSNNAEIDKNDSLLVTQLQKLRTIIPCTKNHLLKTKIDGVWLRNRLITLKTQGKKLIHKWILKEASQKNKLIVYVLPSKESSCNKGLEKIAFYKLIKNVMYKIKLSMSNVE